LTDVLMKDALAGSKLEETASKSIRLTDLPYLAPEQLDSGAAGSPCADLYTLGAVVYTLLTGLPPFNGNSASEIHDQIRNTKPIRPGKLQAHIPAPFEAVVVKLLAKGPKDRYQTAAELLAEVEAIAKEHDIKL
jgi:serine/threonine protein kinase